MGSRTSLNPDTQERRRRRLEQIGEEFTEGISDPQVIDQVEGRAPVPPFAAVTSEGSVSGQYKNGWLMTFETSQGLAIWLATSAEDGQASHGRIWDLRSD